MINPDDKLTILIDNAGTSTDWSDEAADYLRDPFDVSLTVGDYLYVGFYKPIGTFFAEINTGNTNVSNMSAEYYDGSVWQPLDISDETNGLARSGFVIWDKENMQEALVESELKFFVRFSVDADTTLTTIQGINIVFSDDNCLKQEVYEIADDCLYSPGFNSHIVSHVSARNHIMQMLRNYGYVKYDEKCNPCNIGAWDIMDIFEIKQAATYLALANLYFRMSDNQDSIEWTKYKSFQDKFEQSFRLVRLTLDSNDNGLTDTNEKAARTKTFTWSR